MLYRVGKNESVYGTVEMMEKGGRMEPELKQKIAEEMVRIAADGFLMTGAFAGMEVSGSLFHPGYVYCCHSNNEVCKETIEEYKGVVLRFKKEEFFFRICGGELGDLSLWGRSLDLSMKMYALVPQRKPDPSMDFEVFPVVGKAVTLYCADSFDSVTGRGKGRVFLKKKIGRQNVVFDMDFGRYRSHWGMTVDIPQIGLGVDYGKFAGTGHTFEATNPDVLDRELQHILPHVKVFLSELQRVLERFGLAGAKKK